ncbi:HK97-gp10 family putative phage morphogenesis protein [Xenorhabdus stockiae]|uniref:HK97-gp10 family putative phage morphogenesis protein n=1 Tax=Xenorhabdus stockiae TaxID=351614 RepID=UPI003CEF88E2
MISASVSGLEALGRKLQELEVDFQTKVLRQAGKTAMEIVQEDMQAHAGYDSKSKEPHLRDNIKTRSTKSKKYPGGVMITVGPTKAHRMKALAQEMGTIKQVPSPFIRPALDYNKQAVLTALAREISAALSSYSK